VAKADFKYEPKKLDRGYNNRTLYVNLSEMKITSKPVSEKMKNIFTGGRGFNMWLLWNALPKDHVVKWDDPENEVCIAAGPLGGIPVYPGGGKSIAVSISPLTGIVVDSNAGGYFGPYLKFAGWDALEVQGKAESEVVILIDGDACKVQVESAEELPSETHLIVDAMVQKYGGGNPLSISVVSSGPGAEHTLIGCLNISWYDAARRVHRFKQAGRGGIGTVLRDKRVKAIVVKYPGKITVDSNGPADADLVKEIGIAYNREIRALDPKQNEMAAIGSSQLVSAMNNFDLLPVDNFRYGCHPEAEKLGREVYRKKFHTGFDGCWFGCSMSCAHVVKDFELKTGPYRGQRVFVTGPEYETVAGVGSNCGIFDVDYVIEMNYYCDIYGLDTISVLRDGLNRQENHRRLRLVLRQQGRGVGACASDGAWRRLRCSGGSRCSKDEKAVCREVRRRPEGHARHRHGIERLRVLRVRDKRVFGAAGRLRIDA
jgi:aldehyde:ferredoxin oxidoreductase